MMRLLYTWLILALGVLASAHIVPGISYADTPTLVVVVLLLSLFNAVLKPLLLLFTLPFIVLTMGIGVLFINAFLFLMVGWLVQGFYVAGFGSAFLGGLIISLLTVLTNFLFRGRKRSQSPEKRFRGRDDDVIDI